MIANFLIDSRYGGPQMILKHINKKLLKKTKNIFLDKKTNNFNFSDFKKINKILFLIDVIHNLIILLKKKKMFLKNDVFFIFSIVNIVPVIFGIILKKKIIWYILENPTFPFNIIAKTLNIFYDITYLCISDSIGKKLKLKNYKVYFPAINIKYWKSKFNKKNSVPIITFVGNLNKIKNHYQAIKFLNKTKNIYRLNIIGKKILNQNTYYKRLKSIIEHTNKNTKNQIKVYQNKKSEFIKKILFKTDIYILPSKNEGLSISLVEAMSMGKICMVSENSNHSKIIMNNNNGFVFKLNTISFLKTFEKIINLSEKKRKKIYQNSKLTVLNIYLNNRATEKKFKSTFVLNHLL